MKIISAVPIKLIILFTLLIVFSCCNKRKKPDVIDKLGEYVYEDYYGILHSKLKCKGVAKISSAQSVEPIKIEYTNDYNTSRVCSVCFTEGKLKQLYVIKDKRWLFDKFKELGYDVGDNYKCFDSTLMYNEGKREWLYRTAKNNGLDVGDSYEEFMQLIGL